MKFLINNWLAVALVCRYPLNTVAQSPIKTHENWILQRIEASIECIAQPIAGTLKNVGHYAQ